ncbi:hypothetical protein H0I49_03195 [Flavobacterium psychrophilum]|uniref:hypothetical protein n=1 Tax=Flavobacterium psychrophilum TaxID=96345 RepID=UPI001932402D|nr:hypothetical protein [Flavobacterium psychrophilum]QRE33535.1 hypothetical protein H0I49_03195 [Flavobacterium psychrophilum]
MSTDCNSIPAVYYVIQGRALNNDSTYIEHTFMDINPYEARIRAFSYLEYYVQLLQQGKKIFFRENDKMVNTEIKLTEIQNYEISFSENNIGLDGLALYMVINKPITAKDKTDKKEESYLIHAIKNLSSQSIETIKNSLIREYLYYRYFKEETSNIEDQVSLLKKTQKTGFNQPNEFYHILKTPFDFTLADFHSKINQNFRQNISKELRQNNKLKTAFVSNLDYHNIRIQMASLLNTKGGKLFLCNFKNGHILPLFEDKTIFAIKALLKKEIFAYFKKYKNLFTIHFVKINSVLVPIMEVKTVYNQPCYYGNNENNNFYYRTENGLKVMNDTESIVNYISNTILNNKEALDNLLESL